MEALDKWLNHNSIEIVIFEVVAQKDIKDIHFIKVRTCEHDTTGYRCVELVQFIV